MASSADARSLRAIIVTQTDGWSSRFLGIHVLTMPQAFEGFDLAGQTDHSAQVDLRQAHRPVRRNRSAATSLTEHVGPRRAMGKGD